MEIPDNSNARGVLLEIVQLHHPLRVDPRSRGDADFNIFPSIRDDSIDDFFNSPMCFHGDSLTTS